MRGILGQRLKNADSPQAPTLRRGIPVLPLFLHPPSTPSKCQLPPSFLLFASHCFSSVSVVFHLLFHHLVARQPPPILPTRTTIRQCSLGTFVRQSDLPQYPSYLVCPFSLFRLTHSHSLLLSPSVMCLTASPPALHTVHVHTFSLPFPSPTDVSDESLLPPRFLSSLLTFIDAPYARKLFRSMPFAPRFSTECSLHSLFF